MVKGHIRTKGLTIERYFTNGKSVYDDVKWKKSDVTIIDEEGKPVFIQKDMDFPKFYSELAKKIIASRYFYGEPGTDERENSMEQLTERVSETYKKWAIKQNYFNKEKAEIFKDEIAFLTLNQRMAFNSPVWFNVGTDKYASRKSKEKKRGYIIRDGKAVEIPKGKDHLYPQTSACFIQYVPDTMEGITQLTQNEAMIFRNGSGTGTDLSTLRSLREKLSGGGKPSGPLAYLIFYDKQAGIVKSGGKTRRAAKMDSLKTSHPDIKEFIEAKPEQEEIIRVLIEAGVNEKKAIENAHFQNTNLSVRVTNEFMKTVENNKEWQTIPVHNKELADKMPKYKARDLFNLIAKGTWTCGDPGIQYHDTINEWHTCTNSAPINASNPCSEYMFIDDSSCNLASLNLMGFVDINGNFNIKDFKKAIELTAIAMDLNYDNSSFPTKKIAENSYKFRPEGMGYANLGALIMSLGLPYDSEEARAIASSITALMTATVYKNSTKMAEHLGPFKEYKKNKELMLNIMKKHQNALVNIDRNKLPKGLEGILDEAEKTWKNVIVRGVKHGFRNAQATVLAPTGTIGFMMDCATKGIEPEIGLVQYKLLVEGGKLKIVNYAVDLALKKLNYDADEIKEIRNYIDENSTVEGCEVLKEEHLPIFDCANKPSNAKRTISSLGHIDMLAAVQPFLSGAISKTVNVPKETKVEDIANIYMEGWKKGLKAVTIYRDGSKNRQPLSFEGGLEKKLKPIRRKLPITRKSLTHKFDIGGHEGYLTAGLYDNGDIGELFIIMSKEGSTIGGLMDCFAISTSLNLQSGVPLRTLIKKFKHQRFEPYGLMREGHKDIHTATSVIDYIFTFLEKTFLPKEEKQKENMNSTEIKEKIEEAKTSADSNIEKKIQESGEPGGYCPICGTQMIKRGDCEQYCPELGCNYYDQAGCGG